ncbi:alpha/beta fold hydrolase [Streptomyces sp. NPDC102409]|uniref:alpha/beta fold hydrolase n=1 Tax=Streptomyces sp. NPDC102409 TaxID=3366172 RepID=UPI00380E6EB1
MATYVLIPGAAGTPWHWHLVEAALRDRGHHVIVVDLPNDDDSAGLSEYADAVVDAVGARGRDGGGVVLVAHSFAGFTAPLVCERVRVDRLVLVTAMVPAPGETPADWWANTGYEQARRERDAQDEGRAPDETGLFYGDVPTALAAAALGRQRRQSGTPFEDPWPLSSWPDVPTTFLLCREDRFFPAPFMRRVVRERLGITADEIDGGHYVLLSRPQELVARLEGYAA